MSFFQRRLSRLQHLSDETISRLLSGELSAVRSMSARAHVDKCWQCRSRRKALDKAAMQIAAYQKNLVGMTPPNPRRREMLLADLRKRAEETGPTPAWRRSIVYLRSQIGNQMIPVLASAVIVVTATFLLIWVWHRPAVPVTAAQLLSRAEISDQVVTHERAGVVYQKVRITTPHDRIERELYHDLRSVRRRRPELLKPETEPVLQVLSSVGVDWQAPLSAASYREWHDRQLSVSDEVRKTGEDLLTLVSKVPNGPIQEESLTVRTSDFHPVGRTVEARDHGTIEIAELNYAVLDWSGVNQALFEPLAGGPHPGPIGPIVLPSLPTAADLDSAELSARVALNQLHADEGEQISISRTHRSVQVKGVVETEERKREIVGRLSGMPHVTADVLSLAELQSIPPEKSIAQSVRVQTVDSQASPLEKHLDAEGRKVELGNISQHLLDAALKVRQSAGELIALRKRFPHLNNVNAKDIDFSQLSQSYTERLRAGLNAEMSTLDALQLTGYPEPSPVPVDVDLAAEVDRNEALCRELIAGGPGSTRTTTEIVPELYKSVARIRSAITVFGPTSAN